MNQCKFHEIEEVAPGRIAELSEGERQLRTREIGEAIRQLSEWIKSASRNADATIESEQDGADSQATEILLRDPVSQEFVIGICYGRAFIASDRPVMRWLYRLPWRRFYLRQKELMNPALPIYGTLELNEYLIEQITGKVIPGIKLMIRIAHPVAQQLRSQACIDVRMHYPEEAAISAEIFSTIPLEVLRGKGVSRKPSPPKK